MTEKEAHGRCMSVLCLSYPPPLRKKLIRLYAAFLTRAGIFNFFVFLFTKESSHPGMFLGKQAVE